MVSPGQYYCGSLWVYHVQLALLAAYLTYTTTLSMEAECSSVT